MKTNQQVAVEVVLGKWGNGADRRKRLTSAGYNYESIQSIVNAICAGNFSDFTLEPEQVCVTGNEIMEVEIDLTKYKGLNITFINGGDDNAPTDT